MKRRIILVAVCGCSFLAGTARGQTILYVDQDAPGPIHDGSNWNNAFRDLQVALAVASSGDEIRVAQGVYTPDSGSGDRLATFQLKFEVVHRGGYAGYGAVDPDERDLVIHETILSGDLFGNDGSDFANNDENSAHVVTGRNGAILDGFTISGGNASDTSIRDGGGLWTRNANMTVTNCIFKHNEASENGGAVYYGSSDDLTAINCVFRENRAGGDGGGIFGGNSSLYNPTLINCTFNANLADRGGGVFIHWNRDGGFRNPTIVNCIFWGNADSAGMEERSQVYAETGSNIPVIMYSLIQGLDTFDTGAGNISGDPVFGPLFVDISNGDLHLRSDSPCIDAGLSIAIPLDLDGNLRTVDDPQTVDTGLGFPSVVDMGAYEFGSHPPVHGDLDGDGDVDLIDYAIWQNSFSGPH